MRVVRSVNANHDISLSEDAFDGGHAYGINSCRINGLEPHANLKFRRPVDRIGILNA